MILRPFFSSTARSWQSPFAELDRMRRDLSRLLEEYPSETELPSGVFPLTNITEDKDCFYLHAELPGVRKEDIEISITGNSLSLSGERKISPEDEKAKYLRRERESGKFRRMIKLPSMIDVDKVEARTENGVLTVILPKAEAAKPKQIAIKAA